MTTMMNCRFEAVSRDRKTKQDKGPASPSAGPDGLLPAVRAVLGTRGWGQNGEEKGFWGPAPAQGTETQENRWGQIPGKEN